MSALEHSCRQDRQLTFRAAIIKRRNEKSDFHEWTKHTLGNCENSPKDARGDVTLSVAIVISSLATGGAQRVVVSLAERWASKGNRVVIVTIDNIKADRYKLHPSVERVALDLTFTTKGWRAIAANLKRVRVLRRAFKHVRPDVIVSFEHTTNILTLLASQGLDIPVAISERVDPRELPLKWSWTALRRAMYPKAKMLIVQTDNVRVWAERFVDPSAIVTIPNPAPVVPRDTEPLLPPNALRTVVGLGRLTHQKGFDLLIKAFSSVSPSHPDWSLVIYGDGKERNHLETLIGELGMPSFVRLPGMTDDPIVALRSGGLFVMPSRFEGFPNVLLEAMACGLPAIAFDCRSGPKEIIRNEVDGLLVSPEDSVALAAAMDRLMSNERERKELGRRALEVTERFSVDKIMSRWDKLLLRLSDSKTR